MCNNLSGKWCEFSKNPLPPELEHLPTITAKPYLRISDGSERLLLEGPAFDRNGNLFICHTTKPTAHILKITPDGEIMEFFTPDEFETPVGLAIHRDGRIFAAALCGENFSKIFIISSDGIKEKEIIPEYNGENLRADDLTFDSEGRIYFTDFRGNLFNPIGGVYRIDPDDDYTKIHCVCKGICSGNGISFSPDFKYLWVAESTANRVLKLTMDDNGELRKTDMAVSAVYTGTGKGQVDSNKVDADGNLYQAFQFDGRILIFNERGVPIANVLVPERENLKNLSTPNLVIKQETNEAYMLATGIDGACLYSFPTFAKAAKLYSDM